MKSIKVPLTESEIEALKKYKGFYHAKINLIADITPDKFEKMSKKGWNLDYSSENIEQTIQDFVNVYSAIYKQGEISSSGILYRGTTNKEVKHIQNIKEINTGYSTTIDENIAKTFMEYDDSAIIRIRTKEGLPRLYIEDLDLEEGKEEKEVLILLFSKIEKLEHTSNWNGHSYYDMSIQKETLPENDIEDTNNTKKQCISEIDNFMTDIKEYNSLSQDYESLTLRSRYQDDDSKYIWEQKSNILNQISKLDQKIKQYTQNFSKMLKGLCKQKELEIDDQREQIKEDLKKEKQFKLQQQIEKLKQDIEKLNLRIENRSELITKDIEAYIIQLERNARQYQNIADDFNISYTQNPQFSMLETLQKIKKDIKQLETNNIQTNEEENKFEDEEKKDKQQKSDKEDREKEIKEEINKLEIKYNSLQNREKKLRNIESVVQTFPELLQIHKYESMQEIKKNLNTRVQRMLADVRISKLQNERANMISKKTSIFHRLTGKTTLNQAKIENIDAKIKLINYETEVKNSENRVGNILIDIYECANTTLEGKYTGEMIDIISKIRGNFKNIPTEEEILSEVSKRMATNYPVVVQKKKFSLFKKNEIHNIQKDTDNIQYKTQQAVLQNRKKGVVLPQSNIITKIGQKLNEILKEIDSADMQPPNRQIQLYRE